MRGLIKGPAEESQKMIAGETGLARNLLEIKRMVIALVYEPASANKPTIGVSVKRRPVTA
jgi:hypothetical protein